MPKEITYTWYICPKDSDTNQAVSSALSGQGFGFETLPKKKGIGDFPLWECPDHLLEFFWKSRKDQNLHFDIYNKQNRGKIRKVTFLFSQRFKQRSRRIRQQQKQKAS